MDKNLEYVYLKRNKKNEWEEANEFVWKMPTDEMAILYAAYCIRLENMTIAENCLKNYIHMEPINIEGKMKNMGIGNAISILNEPFLKEYKTETGEHVAKGKPNTPEGEEELALALKNSTMWKTHKDPGLQIIASINWLTELNKVRTAEITKDNSVVEYDPRLLSKNMIITEEKAEEGYTAQQMQMLSKAKEITCSVLKYCGGTKEEYSAMNIKIFGQRIYKAFLRTFDSLPDPEKEEREKFEKIRQDAIQKRKENE
jgi:hypothetical protein